MFLINYLISLPSSTKLAFTCAFFIFVATIITVPILYSTKKGNQLSVETIILRWNTKGKTVAGITGIEGINSNQLSRPIGLTFDSLNTLYISDYQNNRIQKYFSNTFNGTTIAGQFNGAIGSTSKDFHYPADVIIDSNGNLYASDRYNNRVQFWSLGANEGKTIAGTGQPGTSTNQLNNPWGLSYDTNSSVLYIADCYNNRVVQYQLGSSNGNIVAGGNGQGKNITQLFFPTGIYFDSLTNSLFIANWGCNNIVQWIIGANSWNLIVGSFIGASGSTSAFLNGPYDIIIDPYRNIYVADSANHRIQFFQMNQINGTTIIGSTGKAGNTNGLLNSPYSVQLDSYLNLYVADTFNDRIQRFSRY